MAYNYGFPMTYQPMQYQNAYQQQIPQMSYAQTMQPQQTTQSGIVWVQGEAGAKAYPVAPGSNVLLMDSESECFYIKSTDVSGMPMPLRVFEYKEIVSTQPALPQHSNDNSYKSFNPDDYVKKEELEALKKRVDEMPNNQIFIERNDTHGE